MCDVRWVASAGASGGSNTTLQNALKNLKSAAAGREEVDKAVLVRLLVFFFLLAYIYVLCDWPK